MIARVADYGATLLGLTAADRDGICQDVVLGFDSADDYANEHPYFGSVVGRYANRIAGGRFVLDGQAHDLALNNGRNSLHGGVRGFDKVSWRAVPAADGRAVTLQYTSADGEEGFPGELSVEVCYTLTDDDELRMDYSMMSDRATPVNVTNHAYFNLACGGDVLGHELFIDADRFTPVDRSLIPTGELRAVTETPFDFRRATSLGVHIGDADEQLQIAGGYDHNFVLNKRDRGLALAARVYEPDSGRCLEVLTTEPGVQLYSGNSLDGSLVGKGGTRYGRYAGFCLETQHFPDSPNQPAFPSTILRPGKIRQSTTVYRFSAR